MMPLLKTTTLIGRVAGHAAAMSRLRGEDRHACAANLLEQHALTHPQSIAIKFENRRYTWGQLNAEANRVAAGMPVACATVIAWRWWWRAVRRRCLPFSG